MRTTILLGVSITLWTGLALAQAPSKGHTNGPHSFSTSKISLCESNLEKLMYDNLKKSESLTRQFKAYLKAQPKSNLFTDLFGKKKEENFDDRTPEVESALENLEKLGINVQPVFLIGAKPDSYVSDDLPVIHMKDIALKKRFKFGGQSRTAANIICSEELTSSKRDKSASRFSVESTLSYLKKELSELMGPDYSPKDKVLASDLRLPKDMSADLKNEYINSVRSMILDIESVQRRLGIRPK